MNKLPTPKCNKCKSSSNMVDHDGEWVCHSTHRENQSATPRTDAHQMIDGMAHDHLWSNFAETLERELQQANDYADRLVEHKDMVCLPADLANLREANTYFAIENEMLKNAIANDRDAARAEGIQMEEEIKTVTEQRDALLKMNEVLCQFMNAEFQMTLGDPRLTKLQAQMEQAFSQPKQIMIKINKADGTQEIVIKLEHKSRDLWYATNSQGVVYQTTLDDIVIPQQCEAVETKNMATETLSVIKEKYGLGQRNVMKELQHKVAELEKILKDCLYEMPCSYVPNHTVENLPRMIASQTSMFAEEITHSEKLVKQRDLLIEVLEVALNATVLNHRKDRWHSDAEYALHKIKLNLKYE